MDIIGALYIYIYLTINIYIIYIYKYMAEYKSGVVSGSCTKQVRMFNVVMTHEPMGNSAGYVVINHKLINVYIM